VTFKEGLLKARGQITFVTALAVSTGIIIYLEALDTEARIQARVAAEMSRQRSAAAPAPQPLQAAVGAALREAQANYESDPGAAASRAALLTSFSSAVQLGVLGPEDGLARVGRLLDEMEQRPGERTSALVSALGAAAAAFPTLQDRIARLSSAR
jgi:hypothetical protein